ncbi:alpha/beta hydrolase, putative [Plasmodium ovale curtisi]|uniref:Alpha/beta hydrolase, putative n=1 Tax=Plasmodium ovale curtisi TaxID=864141 RepID=A0A1A8VSU3_PLAOA|nr:alpha/beta hydrolase, putative [Plasmodium ovale curtisi]SBS82406.1 alpha/beta hydrolase, putative [Plasmodium ovale curtisi]
MSLLILAPTPIHAISFFLYVNLVHAEIAARRNNCSISRLPGFILCQTGKCMDMFHLYELLMFFLRHPRDKYEEDFLGPIFLHFYDKNYYRRDLIIKNRRGEKLKCCLFTPFNYNENTPCVIYTHSTRSCQLEALDILHILLICECSIFSYDCAGCGLSDGYYSTKGWNESQDLFLILNHLRNVEKIKNFALWGKYSGAASSIITAALDGNIKLLILDSPYVSLIELYKTTFHLSAKRKREVIFKNICLYFARRKIKKDFQYDINNVCPVFFIEDITIPTIYIFSRNDTIVHPAHSLYLAYKQDRAKKIIYISEKATQSHEAFTYDSKLTIAIKSVLYGSPFETDVRNIFDLCTYSRTFNTLRDRYAYEFDFIDRLVRKKWRQKSKIVQKVKKFIYFKYLSKSSLGSSSCLKYTKKKVHSTHGGKCVCGSIFAPSLPCIFAHVHYNVGKGAAKGELTPYSEEDEKICFQSTIDSLRGSNTSKSFPSLGSEKGGYLTDNSKTMQKYAYVWTSFTYEKNAKYHLTVTGLFLFNFLYAICFLLLPADENEYPQQESSRNDKRETNRDKKFSESGIANEYEDLFLDVHNMMDESKNTDIFKNYHMENLNLNKFHRNLDHIGQNDERPFKILHMQSSRSSLKSKKNTYKKSLTWDSKIHSSITYFKEDCPFELLRNE